MMVAQIPIIDLAEFDENEIVEKLKETFSTVGVMYLKNHGITQEKIDDLMEVSRSFFSLPLDVKAGYRCKIESTFDGFCSKTTAKLQPNYTSDGTLYEKREFFDFNAPDCLYPDELCPTMRRSVGEMASEFQPLATRLLEYLALSLELKRDYFTSCHQKMFEGNGENVTFLRSQYYPALPANKLDAAMREVTMRIRPHTDFGTITLIIQDESGGLEVKSGDKWLPAKPIPGTILVVAANLLQRWTGDKYKAALHQVTPGFRNDGSSPLRQSIQYFVHPDTGTMVAPFDHSDKYTPIEATAAFKNQFDQYLDNSHGDTCSLPIDKIRKIMKLMEADAAEQCS